MATIQLTKYICDDGSVLIPLGDATFANLVSDSGKFYLAVTETISAIEAGNPIGLLLALTYA